MIDRSSPMLKDSTVERDGVHIEEELDIESLPMTPSGAQM